MLFVDLFKCLAVEILGKVIDDNFGPWRFTGWCFKQLDFLGNLSQLFGVSSNQDYVEA